MHESEVRNLVDEMYTEAARLKTFKTWPFQENVKCSGAKMAEAGFFHCPTEQEPDLVQCFVCLKELDGWEENDEPWEEHFSHSKICVFAKIRKPQNKLTISEIFSIEIERKVNKAKKAKTLIMKGLKSKMEEMEGIIFSAYDQMDKK